MAEQKKVILINYNILNCFILLQFFILLWTCSLTEGQPTCLPASADGE